MGSDHLEPFRLGFEKSRIYSLILLLRICSRSTSRRISGDENWRQTTLWHRHRHRWSAYSIHAGVCSLGKSSVAHRSHPARNRRGKEWLSASLNVMREVFQGFMLPCLNALWSTWAPRNDRSKLAAFSLAGRNQLEKES